MHHWHWLWYLLYVYLLIGAIPQLFFIKAEIEEYYDDLWNHFMIARDAARKRSGWGKFFSMPFAIFVCGCGVISHFIEWCATTSLMVMLWPATFFVSKRMREQLKKIPPGTSLRDMKYYIRIP
jgi:hypothetical protein